MAHPSKRPPRRNDDRIILQFDYDCFYAQVIESKNPPLKSKPLGVKQKNILATCNYKARDRGVRKLMLISEARKICPDLVLADGEDLTAFRDTSKALFGLFRAHSWNDKVERLGLDEVFMDVTDIVDYNILCLNTASLSQSFFHLSKKEPEKGFECDLTAIAGCVEGSVPDPAPVEDRSYLRLLLGSHLANYLRLKVENDFGYTSTCGISTNKVLSKLVGARNKPRNQTTLLALDENVIIAFVDSHKTRQIPGLGFKTSQQLESHVLGVLPEGDSHSFTSAVFCRDIRLHPDIAPGFLETLLAGAGSEKGIGARVWNLLHGVDHSEVKTSSDIPSQISIEDTYKGLETLGHITEELFKLSCSLIRRMRVDLLARDQYSEESDSQRWIARPKTLRLSVRSWPLRPSNAYENLNFSRVSRSGPLPSFVFNIKEDIEPLAEQLVAEAVLPLLRKLQPEKAQKWNLQLINICVANMVAGAADDKQGTGRDIGVMFKRQEEVLRPFRIDACEPADTLPYEEVEEDIADEASWDEAGNSLCSSCGRYVPMFAASAHSRYHEMGQ